MTRAFVTGATGFIGPHLVEHLTRHGYQVTCLVRPHSDRRPLEFWKPDFAVGDVTNRDSIRQPLAEADVVFHLAGATKSLRKAQLFTANEVGTRNVAACCAEQNNPPTLICVSSLAAAGPSAADRARIESDPLTPVSNYGHSKLAGESAALEFASDLPISIVRPPIVLGEGDRDGFEMFKTIANLRLHLVPSLANDRVSVIHARDLATGLRLTAERGKRVSGQNRSTTGFYFATSDETPTYAELGKMIGASLGRSRVLVIRNLKTTVWCIAAVNELVAQLRRRPHILSLDKAREATAGSWTCSAGALRTDTGFAPARQLQQRLDQIASWYVEQGWLKDRGTNPVGQQREGAANQC